VVTVEARSSLPDDDYLKNKFFDTADTRRVYRFDDLTGLLEAVQVYVRQPAGDALIFELQQIEYNLRLAPELFHVELPPDVSWHGEIRELPDNEKYASMSAEEVAKSFFEACGQGDWNEVAKFFPHTLQSLPGGADKMRRSMTGLTIVSLGESFTSRGYPGRFVPYEIRMRDGSVRKHNLALKKDSRTGRWFVDGGI
jgi:hypothetical protein